MEVIKGIVKKITTNVVGAHSTSSTSSETNLEIQVEVGDNYVTFENIKILFSEGDYIIAIAKKVEHGFNSSAYYNASKNIEVNQKYPLPITKGLLSLVAAFFTSVGGLLPIGLCLIVLSLIFFYVSFSDKNKTSYLTEEIKKYKDEIAS